MYTKPQGRNSLHQTRALLGGNTTPLGSPGQVQYINSNWEDNNNNNNQQDNNSNPSGNMDQANQSRDNNTASQDSCNPTTRTKEAPHQTKTQCRNCGHPLHTRHIRKLQEDLW